MNRRTHLLPALVASAALAVSPLLGAAPATAAPNDRGLFGTQDPTYDGVYRQSLAIAGLAAVDRAVPRRAVRWLLRQQCGSGAFLSYRPDPAQRCPAPDPQSFTGPDSNSTAMAAMALRAVGERRAARAAIRALRTMQNRDGGFAFYARGASDVNSTGLALSALQGLRPTAALRADVRAATAYLRTAQLRCEGTVSDRGLLSYVPSPKVGNPLASAQGALGLVTTLPVAEGRVSARRATPPLQCVGGRQTAAAGVRDTLLDGLARALVRSNGLLPSATGSGTDPSASAQAAIALSAAGRSSAVVRLTVRRLRQAAPAYTGSRSTADAGALGTLLLLADAAGLSPRAFDVNLVRELRDAAR